MHVRNCYSTLLSVSMLLTTCGAAARESSNQAGQERDQVHWLEGLGLGFRSGAAFRETAIGRDFTDELSIGGELLVGILGYRIHRVVLSAGYLHTGDRFESGTAKVKVRTELKGRIDLSLGYEIKWKALLAGARIGSAMTIVSTRVVQKELDYYVENNQLVFTETGVIDEKEASGADPGFLTGLGIGADLGPLFGFKNLIEIRAQGDYLRRGQRDEFFVWGMLAFWPLELFI